MLVFNNQILIDSVSELKKDSVKGDKIKKVRGYVFGEVKHGDGRVEKFEDIVNKKENLVVNRASIVLARLMKGDLGSSSVYLAVGTGYGASQGGTPQNPKAPSITDTLLESEIARKLATISYYDLGQAESDTIIYGNTTNKLKFSASFSENEAVGVLTELGLFTGSGASNPNGGLMISRFTFPAWNKSSSISVTWHWVIVF